MNDKFFNKSTKPIESLRQWDIVDYHTTSSPRWMANPSKRGIKNNTLRSPNSRFHSSRLTFSLMNRSHVEHSTNNWSVHRSSRELRECPRSHQWRIHNSSLTAKSVTVFFWGKELSGIMSLGHAFLAAIFPPPGKLPMWTPSRTSVLYCTNKIGESIPTKCGMHA